ncbi:MAG: topoisomerase C-terminal repeat-containing protein, partial [Candidatus Paceibacterota bacterium]
EIAAGEASYEETLEEFYTPFHKQVESKEDIPKITNLGDAPEEIKCPDCEKAMVVKLGRSGKFFSCKDFPDCKGARTLEGKVLDGGTPIGKHPETDQPIYVKEGPYGPYVEMPIEGKKKPKRGSIPKEKDPEEVTIKEAVKYLSLPRTLGEHPETGNKIQANIGRFGPYIVHQTKPKPDYRSLKEDDVYTIKLDRALEILKEPKRRRGAKKKKK